MLRKLTAGAAAVGLVLAGTGASVAATGAAPPKQATITAVQTLQVKVNRYVKDGLRWDRDTYFVRSGGSVRVVQHAPQEGPHTFTIVKKSDLPRTPRAIFNCKICMKLGQAHGADPNSEAPPKFAFLENGVGQDTPPNYDRPGDSALIAPKQGFKIDLPVTAKKGTTLYFMCIIHAQMQGKIIVR